MPFETKKFVELIYSNPPLPPCTIDFYLSDNNTMYDLYEVLVYFLETGLTKYHGDENLEINYDSITYESLNKIKLYINSIGYDLLFEVKNGMEHNDLPDLISSLNNSKIETIIEEDGLNLKDYKINMIKKNITYIIYFDIYVKSQNCR